MLTPPTDSLAKFLAVLGVVVIVSTEGLHWRTQEVLNEIRVEHAGNAVALEQFASRAQLLNKSIANLLKTPPTQITPEIARILEDKFARAEANKREWDSAFVAAVKTAESYKVAFDSYTKSTVLSIVGMIAGILMSTYGFTNWWASEKAKTRKFTI